MHKACTVNRIHPSSCTGAKSLYIGDMISSEESDAEDEKPVLILKELHWRSEKVEKFFPKLDSKPCCSKI